MGEWVDFSHWPECPQMERPGIVFEVESTEGELMKTRCQVPLSLPFNWSGKPVRFRIIEAEEPRHSNPVPPPAR